MHAGGDRDELVVLGYFCGAHGVRGALKVYSHTDPPQAIFSYQPWLIEINGEWQVIDIKPLSREGKILRVRIGGVSEREQAQLWCDREIRVRRSSLPDTSEKIGEYYWFDLIGLDVFNHDDGVPMGRVVGLLETAGHDVLRVRGEQEYLLPWDYGGTIVAVDLQTRKILVNWQEPV